MAKAKTEPAAKPATKTAADGKLLDKIFEEQKALDGVFARLFDEDRQPTPEESAILRRWGPHSRHDFDRWFERGIGRLRGIRKLQSRAGSGADRERAKDEAGAAEAKLASERPQIERQIAELQTRIQEFEDIAAERQAKHDTYVQAVGALGADHMLPVFIRDAVKAAKRRRDPVEVERLKRFYVPE